MHLKSNGKLFQPMQLYIVKLKQYIQTIRSDESIYLPHLLVDTMSAVFH